MGNKLGRKRQIVDDRHTRPQGLYQNRGDFVDHKKLRRLILDSKLAPCYPGDEEFMVDLEECPICFLYYPSLNRSRCCMKGICTECFLQMKPPHSTRPTQCPFCKTSNYAVEYRGVKTKEEKGMEQVEEQRFIEAKIRMRQQEIQDEEERMQKRLDVSSSSRPLNFAGVEYQDVASRSLSAPSFDPSGQHDEIVSSQESHAVPAIRQSSHIRQNRDEEFDLDLEDIMVMEAIWLSIQECGTQRNHSREESTPSGPSILEHCLVSQAAAPPDGSPSGGLACAIAALAERQHMNMDVTNDAGSSNASPATSALPAGEAMAGDNYLPEHWIEVSPESGRALSRGEGEWGMDHGSEVAEVGTSYTSSSVRSISDATVEAAGVSENSAEHFPASQPVSIIPESFEEQMMLAMAVSLAEARGERNSLSWL